MESHLKKQVISYLNKLKAKGKPIYFYKTTGQPVGIPDLIVCLNGNFIGIELKTYEGKMSPAQKFVKGEIERAGGKVFVVRSLIDLQSVLDLFI